MPLYFELMRRWIAVVMLVLLGGMYAEPLVAAATNDSEANLPACCRRHGKHHCTMMTSLMEANASGRAQVGVTPERCGMYPRGTAAVGTAVYGAPGVSAAVYAEVVSHPAVQAQTEARYRLALDRARQKRGPPSGMA